MSLGCHGFLVALIAFGCGAPSVSKVEAVDDKTASTAKPQAIVKDGIRTIYASVQR